ncbi:MAG TPA: murein transglycosylase domain-containing protein [Bacteroidetes bacterium]|nr:murein transglycosylase domain-containing protein [Candidatus Limimorpha avicola]
MKRLLTLLLLITGLSCFAQVESDFEKFKREQQEQLKAMKDSQNDEIKAMIKEYDDYVKAEKEAYNAFVKKMSALWGEDNVTESTQTNWVEYYDDGKTRSDVDFENGEATIEIILDEDTSQESKEEEQSIIENKIENSVKRLLITKGKTKDYDTPMEKAVPLQSEAVLENQVQTPSGKMVTEETVEEDAKEIAAAMVPEVKTIKGSDGKERKVVTVKLDLVPDHLRTRAEQYKNEVEKYCNMYDLEPALVYAVIQTESAFNPKAKSHVPAYGLMQIVPNSAGKDCAQSLKKPFDKPTANYLYEPNNNIEMGVHYLYLLRKRYFNKVTDTDKSVLCMIASYNTGAGNLARALRGDTNISKAIPKINEMSYKELFSYLEKHLLPETQNYIRRVSSRMDDFNKWIK